jgi:hypothetical protein
VSLGEAKPGAVDVNTWRVPAFAYRFTLADGITDTHKMPNECFNGINPQP